ncbi:hypothetical protein B0H14DRAFT_2345830 [Mycena olivaceomarginata]|nr:hypothetical protein B0H14DRAFT_2345830 [Mycena olivaceomarginata]
MVFTPRQSLENWQSCECWTEVFIRTKKSQSPPSVRNTRRVLRLLGALYRHVLEAYTNVKLSLHEQLTHISAATHLMMAVYLKESGKFVPSQTYFDFMTTGSSASPKNKLILTAGFWLILLGTDPLELSFDQVRTRLIASSAVQSVTKKNAHPPILL